MTGPLPAGISQSCASCACAVDCGRHFDRRTIVRNGGLILAAAATAIGVSACGLEGAPIDPRIVTVPRKSVPEIGGRPFKSLNGEFFLVRNDAGILAMAWGCTHLGCPTNWSETAQQFQCPCHGAKFTLDGSQVEGPALRPLDLYQIVSIADGDVRVKTEPWIMRERYSSEQVTPYE